MNKKIIDYSAMNSYDRSLFDPQDWAEYKAALDEVGYIPELAEFFHEEQRKAWKQKRTDTRHIAFSLNQSDCSCLLSDKKNPETDYINKERIAEISNKLSSILSKEEYRRLMAWGLENMNCTEIAKAENVSRQCVSKTISRSIKKIMKLGCDLWD